MQYLVHLQFSDPPGFTDDELTALRGSETERAHALQRAGILTALWRDPGQRASWTLWEVASADHLDQAVRSLPYWPWMLVDVYPLARHPNALTADPGTTSSGH
jgi:muconolactone D-isomerase